MYIINMEKNFSDYKKLVENSNDEENLKILLGKISIEQNLLINKNKHTNDDYKIIADYVLLSNYIIRKLNDNKKELTQSEEQIVEAVNPLNDNNTVKYGGNNDYEKTEENKKLLAEISQKFTEVFPNKELFTKKELDLKKKISDNNYGCPTVIFIFHPDCGYCKIFYESWNKLVDEYDKYIINMNPINAKMEKNKNIISNPKLDVKGFPSLYIVNDNKIYNLYDRYQEVNYENVKKFIIDLI